MTSRYFYATLVLAIGLLSSGCSDDPISIVKNGYLSAHPTTTVGKAFDNYSYFTNTKWRTETLPNGIRTVTVSATTSKSKLYNQEFAAPFSHVKNVDSALVEYTFMLNADDTFFLDSKRLIYTGKNLQQHDLDAMSDSCKSRGKMTDIGCEVNWKPTKMDIERVYMNGVPVM